MFKREIELLPECSQNCTHDWKIASYYKYGKRQDIQFRCYLCEEMTGNGCGVYYVAPMTLF